MSFDVGWQLEESCGEKTRFHFVYCHIEEIPGWATDGRVHKCILKYAYEIDFLWSNLAVGPVCLEPIAIP